MAATYQVVSRLAAGGMAELFFVRGVGEGPLAPPRVIKRILPHLCGDPACESLFLSEGRLGLRLSHPNVIRTLAVGTGVELVGVPSRRGTGIQPFILLEYLDGLDLSRFLRALARRGTRMSVAEVVGLGLGLARGLAHAHAGGVGERGMGEGIVHRDVTPSNIMLTVTGGVKLIDFGVASLGPSEADASGCIKGKLAYMAPEQICDGPVDARADQYALALVLWECLAGEACFLSGDHFATLARVARGEIRPIDRLRADVSPRLRDVLARALARAPADRFATMAHLARALDAAAAGVIPRLDGARVLAARDEDVSGSQPPPVTQVLAASALGACAPYRPPLRRV